MTDWPQRYANFWQQNPRPQVSITASLKKLQRRIDNMKAGREAHVSDYEDAYSNSDRLEYLRGPGEQRDRETIWKNGLGII